MVENRENMDGYNRLKSPKSKLHFRDIRKESLLFLRSYLTHIPTIKKYDDFGKDFFTSAQEHQQWTQN